MSGTPSQLFRILGMRRMMILAIMLFLWAGNGNAQSGGTFPPEPFNGMQINYDITGVTVANFEDSPGYTWARTLTISEVQTSLLFRMSHSIGELHLKKTVLN